MNESEGSGHFFSISNFSMAMVTLKTHLSVLSQDEVALIACRLQDPPHQLLPLLTSEQSPFTAVTHLLFETLCVESHDEIQFDFDNSTLIVGLQSDYAFAESLLEACGRVFRVAKLDKVTFKDFSDDGSTERFVQLFARFITPQTDVIVTKVTNEKTMELFTKYLGGNANSLKMDIDVALPRDFARCFPPSLKVFNFCGTTLKNLDTLWELIGGSLEEVELIVGVNVGWKESMAKLRLHCQNLTSINLLNPLDDPMVTEAYFLDFLLSYGKQLLKTDLNLLGIESCERIADGCANVRCTVESDGCDFSRISILHNRLETLWLNLDLGIVTEDGNNWEALHTAMKSCTSLLRLTVFHDDDLCVPFPHDCIRAIFPIQMHVIQSIVLGSVVKSHSLMYIASVTSQLRALQVTCLLPISPAAFSAICTRNARLEFVKISEISADGAVFQSSDAGDTDTRQVVGDFVEAFLMCPALRRFVLDIPYRNSPTEEELRNLCVPFRLGSVFFEFIFRQNRFHGFSRSQPKFEQRFSSNSVM